MTSHFSMENEVNKLLRMDAPLTKGPQMRWQRKLNDSCPANVNESLVNCSMNASMNQSCTKTPMKAANKSLPLSARTPCKTPCKTPSKVPGVHKATPSRSATKTPNKAADRFIPNRSSTNFDLGHYLITSQAKQEDEETLSPSKKEFQQIMNDNVNGELLSSKIMSYHDKPPSAPEGYQNSMKVLYSQNKTVGSTRKTTRHIPQVPERILDAPEILDDYYLNLLDWSANNHLAVCLGSHVYLWNAGNGEIQQLMEMENSEDYVTSVSWIKEGNYLAIGTSSAEVQLWDVEKQKRLRSMTGHSARVGALAWNDHILSSGSRSGYIHHHDVRIAEHQVASLAGHTQEVCGLKWSPDGKYLASGANDNLLHIWPAEGGQCFSQSQPLYTFSQHQAAVKALAWCPWQPSLLASGGGTADRYIRFWNCNTGTLVSGVDTKSQVCSILWSKEYKELVSSHGFAQNQLIIWKYPSMTKVAELTGHTSRVLHLAMSPDGSTVVSAAADETLRLWKCFAVDPQRKKSTQSSTCSSTAGLMSSLRIR